MGAQTSRVPLPDKSIPWYRTPLDPEVSARLHAKSDVWGAAQTLGYLGNLALWAYLALSCYAAGHLGWAYAFTAMYGMQANFLINGMHELGHGHVFKTKWLNSFFLRVVSFIGWLHPDMFFSSHLRHHRYTQNEPWDQEAPQPVLPTVSDFMHFGFINVKGFVEVFDQTWRAAFEVYPTGHLWWRPGWEEVCYPKDNPAARVPATQWAHVLLAGHGAILAYSVLVGNPLVFVLFSLGPFYNGWLFWFCNSSQHIGLAHGTEGKEVTDFRILARTFYLGNPIVSMWYWHMNFHIEHHMFAAVPCYNLAALHNAIKHDLPPTPRGLVEMWTEIYSIVAKQRNDPSYVQPVELPKPKSS